MIRLKAFFIFISIISCILLSSCEDDDFFTPPPSGKDTTLDDSALTDYQRDVIDYFTNIALGFEFGTASQITRKWKGEMNVFMNGDVDVEHENELTDIIKELNDLITDDFSIEIVTNQADADFHIFLGSADEYADLYPVASSQVSSNWGLFYIYWNSEDQLNRGHMYVDITRANSTEQLHLLREEFTQSLGLARDATTYSNSIFQSEWTTTTSYADIDKDLIRLLYHPTVTTGLAESQVRPILIDILANE